MTRREEMVVVKGREANNGTLARGPDENLIIYLSS